jgi:hypothetical protein
MAALGLGFELVVGARREPRWGPILTVGLDGIWIEALHDIRISLADIDRDGIIEELRKLKAWRYCAAAAVCHPRTAPPSPTACRA